MEQPSIDGTREEWLVYGDALQQDGDPRGELIVLNDKVVSGQDATGRDVTPVRGETPESDNTPQSW